METRPRFHLAFPVNDLNLARGFYADLLGCAIGREDARWIDFDLGGHQITAHLVEAGGPPEPGLNAVDGDRVPVRHFGLILEWPDWERLAERVRASGRAFLLEPRVRFEGEVGEQGTFFLRDPAGNALEFKSFRDDARVFAR
jgi:extradiol dioxygenase family protein